METVDLLEVINRGEDSRHQFKKGINNVDSIAAEMVAFSNSLGGRIFIGVDKDGRISGLSEDDLRKTENLISNAASQNVRPAINPLTENVETSEGFVVVVTVPSGINKPYQDSKGAFWFKSGADKRRETSREELQRMFQSSGLIHADDTPVSGATIADLDLDYFKEYYLKRLQRKLDDESMPLSGILENMRLLKEGSLTIGATLLFAKTPQFLLPAFIVKAEAFDSNDLITSNYNDSRNIEGKMSDVYHQSVGFIVSNLRRVQTEQGFNSIGVPEIPPESLGELVANALMHRDYFTSAPVRIFVFIDRVEIISPGHLPNNLTVDNIKSGNSNARNPTLTSHASHILPYRGIGSGIINALAKHPHIDFIDNRENNQFKAILKRGVYNNV